MRVPVAEVMELPKQTPSNWVKLQVITGTAGDGRDVSKAIQQAIDDGAETIYFLQKGVIQSIEMYLLEKEYVTLLVQKAELKELAALLFLMNLP